MSSVTESRYRATPPHADEPALHEIEVEVEDVQGWRLRAWYAGGHEIELYATPITTSEDGDGPTERQIMTAVAQDVFSSAHADIVSSDERYYQTLLPELRSWAGDRAAAMTDADISALYDRA